MKKSICIILLVLVMCFAFVGCNTNNETKTAETIIVSAEFEQVTIDTKQISGYDFKALFKITVNGEDQQVENSNLDKSQLPILPGVGSITCTYKDQSATITVTLVEAEKDIVVSTTQDSVTVYDEQFDSFDFTGFFAITVEGKYTTVRKTYLTTSNIVDGHAQVTCSYMNKQAVLDVQVQKTEYVLSLSQDSIDVNQHIVDNYDFLSIFQATKNGEPYNLTASNVTSNVSSELGQYTYIVTVGTLDSNKVTKTLTVNVVFAHKIDVINSYNNFVISKGNIQDFDFTTLFSMYVDGFAVKVLPEMINSSELVNVEPDKEYKVYLNYKLDDDEVNAFCTVKIQNDDEISIIGKNVEIDINSNVIDLTKLFEIRNGQNNVAVEPYMISGEVDYLTAGEYEITCKYASLSQKATVRVKEGVIINFKNGSVIQVIQGTNQKTYNFANDFIVKVNGIVFRNIEQCIDTSNVDFSTVGEYEATITINYNTQAVNPLPFIPVEFEQCSETIKYVVVSSVYSLDYPTDVVIIPANTTKFNPLSKLGIKINNINAIPTLNKEDVSSIACYVELLSQDIDFNVAEPQDVKIAVYVYGPNLEPVVITYQVCMQSDVVITPINKVIFVGDTIYTKDLFNLTENGKEIKIDNSMISGKVDTFVPGVYYVTLAYKGNKHQSKVIVYSKEINGEYATEMKTLAKEEEVDEDNDVISSAVSAKPIGDMVINNDIIVVDGVVAKNVEGVDEHTMTLTLKSNKYTLYFNNGIVVLEPDNTIKLTFSDYKRPLMYYNKALWEADSSFVVNSSSEYVLPGTSVCYSIDIVNLKSKQGQQDFSYGMKVHLVSRTSSDTVYDVTHGEVVFAKDFENVEACVSSMTFNGEKYDFTVKANNSAKVNKDVDADRLIANSVFTGTYEGKPATLRVDQYGHYTFEVDGINIFYAGFTELFNEMKYGGYDPNTQTIKLFSYLDLSSKKPFLSLRFDIKMQDEQDESGYNSGTFEIQPKTSFAGKYVLANKYIFLDGYGNGLINYNTSSYYTYKFEYEINAGVLYIKYLDTNVTFPYGDSASFFIDSFNNVLRIRDFYDESLIGESFENSNITDGAIIKVKSTVIGKTNISSDAREELENNISIITKDGELTGAEKSKLFNCKTVRFGEAGFYRFGITVNVGGQDYETYYVIQVLDSVYEGNPLVGTYSSQMLGKGYSLTIDKYGRAILTTSNGKYTGSCRISGNEYFAYINDNEMLCTLRGKMVIPGLISIKASGTVNIDDYVTTGSIYVSGTENYILRKFVIDSQPYIFLSNNSTRLGDLAEVSIINGSLSSANSILKVQVGVSEKVVKVLSWDNLNKGLVQADEFYGTYSKDDNTLIIDGFGLATFNGTGGVYQINSDKSITLNVGPLYYFITLDVQNHSYQNADLVIDESIMVGKNLCAEYEFVCYNNTYTAKTNIQFFEGGIVVITSESTDHDDKSNGCVYDVYSPVFASATGFAGLYTINGNLLTITVKDYTIMFRISDVTRPDIIVCISTNIDENTQGYFGIGQKFSPDFSNIA